VGQAFAGAVFIVIPSYNEGAVLGKTVENLLGSGHSIVVVDDGSTDDTQEVLRGLEVHRLRHPVNMGQGAALQTGTDYALSQGAKYIVHFDADGQHPPDRFRRCSRHSRRASAISPSDRDSSIPKTHD
jgi:glycosyltransferase involved in cell wall biosynthesis